MRWMFFKVLTDIDTNEQQNEKHTDTEHQEIE
jgi:hypothetical protein